MASFHSYLPSSNTRLLTVAGLHLSSSAGDPSYPHLPANHPHLLFARKIFDAITTGNYRAFSRVVRDSCSHLGGVDSLQLAIVYGATDRMREHAWNVLGRAYLQVSDTRFVADMLLFGHPGARIGLKAAERGEEEGQEELGRFLEGKGFAGPEKRLAGGGLVFRPRRTETTTSDT
jgi:hypothetical protein